MHFIHDMAVSFNSSQLSSERFSFLFFFLIYFLTMISFFAVDDLFKEASVGSDGFVHYEEFARMVTLPPVDY